MRVKPYPVTRNPIALHTKKTFRQLVFAESPIHFSSNIHNPKLLNPNPNLKSHRKIVFELIKFLWKFGVGKLYRRKNSLRYEFKILYQNFEKWQVLAIKFWGNIWWKKVTYFTWKTEIIWTRLALLELVRPQQDPNGEKIPSKWYAKIRHLT